MGPETAPVEDEKLEVPPLPMLVPCVRPGPLLTYVELPEVPTIVPELSARQTNLVVLLLDTPFLQHASTDAAP